MKKILSVAAILGLTLAVSTTGYAATMKYAVTFPRNLRSWLRNIPTAA